MPRPGRILVVDDSVVARRVLVEIVEADPWLELAGAAAGGAAALRMAAETAPDVVILDVEMPGMDGLAVLDRLRREHPEVAVVMFSAPTERSAASTLEALSRGATDFVLKPASAGSLGSAKDLIRGELIAKVKLLCGLSPAVPDARPTPRHGFLRNAAVGAVAIGCSTGGPNALARLLPLLPQDLRVPVLIVQHMPPVFTALLAQRLDAACAGPVREGHDGARVRPGEIWIAPGGVHLAVRGDAADPVLELDPRDPVNSCRPSVDVLFESVATTFGEQALAIVLTGLGSDGVQGCRQVRARGGEVLVQDRESATVWGMPGAVVQAGLADAALSLEGLAARIHERSKEPAWR